MQTPVEKRAARAAEFFSSSFRRPLRGLLGAYLVLTGSPLFAGEADCGPLTNHFGPFDYYTAPPDQRRLVERPHFSPNIEQLKKGNSGTLGAEISYTLSVFPNHPRALLSMSQLALREKRAKPTDSGYTMDCWFDRAMRFSPNDATVRMLYGIYLLKVGKAETATRYLEEAAELGGENANLSYNLGLAYFSLNDYAKSLDHAHRAYALGFQLPGLRNKLQRAGKWREAEPSARRAEEDAAPAPVAPVAPAANAANAANAVPPAAAPASPAADDAAAAR